MKEYIIVWSGHHSKRINEKKGTLEELKKYFGGTLSWSNKAIKSIKSLVNELNKCEGYRYNGYDPYYYELKTI